MKISSPITVIVKISNETSPRGMIHSLARQKEADVKNSWLAFRKSVAVAPMCLTVTATMEQARFSIKFYRGLYLWLCYPGTWLREILANVLFYLLI